MVGTPSHDALQDELRRAIAEYMRTKEHVAVPKDRDGRDQTGVGQIRFSAVTNGGEPATFRFSTEATWEAALRRVNWFIPPQYNAIRPPPTDAAFAVWFDIVAPVAP